MELNGQKSVMTHKLFEILQIFIWLFNNEKCCCLSCRSNSSSSSGGSFMTNNILTSTSFIYCRMFSSPLDRHFYTMSITLNYIHHSVLVIVRRKKFYIQVSLQHQNGKGEKGKGWGVGVAKQEILCLQNEKWYNNEMRKPDKEHEIKIKLWKNIN